ncbi:MAG: pantoate--beta-alanine ligase [Phycisphaerales bacterium]|jgi:pantoate--beta-alanine ligase
MRIIEDPSELQAPDLCGCGFVPTMGALHAGHGSLVTRAAQDGRPVVVSIFVNPTQFGPNEDYARYPRTLDADCALLEPLGAAAVFVPSVDAIYPNGLAAARGESDALSLPEVATRPGLEDACRPGHFGGVALVVGRLFDLVKPGAAYFGEKDYQQLRLVQDMVSADRARFGGLRIVPCPTIRERDGLAMSSRNRYLSSDERTAAIALARALQVAHSAQRVETAERLMRETLDSFGLSTEYAVVRDALTLMPVAGFERPTRALIAARLGSTRLIDNAAMTVWR